jgi:hypothetical protein
MLIGIWEKIDQKRGTVDFHRDADSLLKIVHSELNKYVID